MENSKFNRYGFSQSEDFDGLMSKIFSHMDDCVIGESDEVVSIFDPTANGVTSMEVVSSQLVALSSPEEEKKDDDDSKDDDEDEGGDDEGDDEEHDFTKPEETVNTPEQEAVAESILSGAENGETNFVITGQTINNINITTAVTKGIKITGEFQDGATISSDSDKYITLTNTGDPVDIVLDCNGTVYLKGEFNNIYTNKSISVSSGEYPKIYGTITVDPEYEGNISISADFQDGAAIQTLTEGTVTISNQNPDASIEVYAPNASVNLGGKYDELTADVSDDTLIMKVGCHVNKLNLKKGNVKFYGIDSSDFIGEFIGEGSVSPMSWDVPTEAKVSSMASNAGIYNIVEDCTYSNAISFGIFGTGKFNYNLNNHTLTLGSKSTGCLYMRGSAEVNIYGGGKIVNNAQSYGVWTNGTTILNVYGGDFEAYTHVLYAYEGTINVYGGTFKLLDAETADKDANGHFKFLLNCYDANYTAGKAHINVYGGKFYNFDPSNTYGEPGGPVSYVAEGYKVVESEEDGVPVFEVVKDE